MHSNKKDDNGWVLCPSKRNPGQFYYFNVVNGEAVWSLSDAKKSMKNSFREPKSTQSNKTMNQVTFNKQGNMPTFGQISFPKYVANESTSNSYFCMQNKNMPIFGQNTAKVVWTPMPLMVLEPNEATKLDQVTQTSELEKVLVHSCKLPLCNRFINYKTPTIFFTKDKLKNNVFTSTPIKPSPTFDQIQTQNSEMKKKSIIKDGVLDINNLLTNKEKTSENSLFLTNKNKNSFSQSWEKSFADLNLEEKEKHVEIKKMNDFNSEGKEKSVNLINQYGHLNMEEKGKNGDFNIEKPDIENLDKNDLRLFLIAKKRRYNEQENSGSTGNKKIKLKYSDDRAETATSKKRVTFAASSPAVLGNENYSSNVSIQMLKSLADTNARQDCWYIIVDTDVLLENYEFLNNFVMADDSCRLLIPEGQQREVQALCMDSSGRRHVFVARRISRSLRNTPRHLAFYSTQAKPRVDFYTDTNIMPKDDILNCCLQIMKQTYHVVLLSNNEDLLKKATALHIHAYKFDYIKCSNKPNDIDKLFNSTKFQSPTHKMFQNIPGLLGEKTLTKKNIFDDESISTEMTSEINRVIQGMNLKNESRKVGIRKSLNSEGSKPFLFQKTYFENGTNATVDIVEKNNLFHFQNSNEEALQRPNGNVNPLTFATDNENSMTKISVENNLKRFYIKHKVMEDKIKDRIEEWMCIFTQIMEDALSYVLQNSSFKMDLILPWTLQEMLERITIVYKDHTMLNIIVNKLLICMAECMDDKGKVKCDTKPHGFIKTVGCGVLLTQCLKSLQPECEEILNAKQSLTNLLRTLEDDTEMDLDSASKVYREIDKERRLNHVKQPSEIIRYLKRHYADWNSYDELQNEDSKPNQMTEETKIFRIPGKNLNLLKIDNNKTISMTKCPDDPKLGKSETARLNTSNKNVQSSENVAAKTNINVLDVLIHDTPKVTRRVSIIKEFEDRLKKYDLDVLDHSEITTERNNEKPKENENDKKLNKNNLKETTDSRINNNSIHDSGVIDNSKMNSGIMEIVNISDSDVKTVSDTSDSGIGSDDHMTYSLVKTFLSELSRSFISVHHFIDKNISELSEEQIDEDKKTHLHGKVNEVRQHVADIINKLKSIVARESNETAALNTVLSKIDEAANDKRITRYRSVIRKCLEQAEHLHNALKIMLSVTDVGWDGSLSTHAESTTSSIRYLNIFE